MKSRITKLLGLFAMIVFGLTRTVAAQQAQAELSQDYAAVGQPVRLNISVSGARGSQVPQQLHVDGLDARFIGKSEQMQWQLNGGGVSSNSTATYSYLIVPLRQGEFTIPAIPVTVGGKTIKTSPLTLRVAGGQGVPVLPAIPVPRGQAGRQNVSPPPPAQATPRSRGSQSDEKKIAFGDLIIPKKTIYVGEVVPIELRFYFDAGYPVRLPDRPSFSGDGFTVMRFSKPIEKQQEVDGRTYNVVIFQTAISAAKAGTLEVSPATLESQIQLPGSGPSGMDDFFGNFFGSMMSPGDIRQVTVPTQSAKLDVKPLPKEGRPEDFAGAIGQFSLQTSAAPKQAAAGDPISLSVTVAGRGNFDAMGAPILLEADGWRTYPPGEKFQASPSDPIGFNGEKRYEYMLVAREDRTKTPVAQLSFFDPSLEKYVTIKGTAIEVAAKGAAEPAAVAAATPASQPQPSPASVATPIQKESLLTTNFSPGSFTSFASDRRFLVVNGALAVAWSAALILGLGRAVASSSFAREAAARRDSRKLLHKMEDPGCSPEQFFQRAEEFVHSRLASNGTHSDVRELLENSRIGDDTRSAIRAVLNRHDEWKYSSSAVHLKLEPAERKQILDQLKSFDHELQK
ncbi:MAG: BatD family protein [Terrimicrobiaceae bacterium]